MPRREPETSLPGEVVATSADPRRSQRGSLMAGVVAGVAVMLILSTLVFQSWVDVLRRDNEAEMIFRAQDIVRAIQRYRQDHGGAGPLKLEDLLEPGPRRQYYLRRFYDDPLVPDGKWGLLFLGPDGALLDPNAVASSGGDPLAGTSIFDRDPPTPSPGSNRGTPGLAGGVGSDSGQTAAPGSPRGVRAGTPRPGEVGGLPIAGIKSLSTDKPFRFYKGLTSYSEWLFSYLDLELQQLPGGNRGKPNARPGLGDSPNNPGPPRGPRNSRNPGGRGTSRPNLD